MLERATLVAFDAGTVTATVRYAGSLDATVAGVPVSRAIAVAELVAGRRVAVARFAADQPGDVMVVGVY